MHAIVTGSAQGESAHEAKYALRVVVARHPQDGSTGKKWSVENYKNFSLLTRTAK